MKLVLFLILLTFITSCANVYRMYKGHGLEFIGDVQYIEVPKYVRDRAGKYTKGVERIPYVIAGKSCFSDHPNNAETIITVPSSLDEDVLRILTVTKGEWILQKRRPGYAEIILEAYQEGVVEYETSFCWYSTITSAFLMENFHFTSIKLGKSHKLP